MPLQTHTKRSVDNRAESVAPDNTLLTAVEPPPFGTNHAVRAVVFLAIYII